MLSVGRLRLKCDGTRAETRFCLSVKRTSPFKSAGASVQLTTGSRDVRISGSNAGYTMFRGSVKGTGYPLHSPVSPSFPLACVTVCHHISTGLYYQTYWKYRAFRVACSKRVYSANVFTIYKETLRMRTYRSPRREHLLVCGQYLYPNKSINIAN
jgi:hypothetical protein